MKHIQALTITLITLTAAQSFAAPKGYTDTPFIPGTKWRVHDLNRPRPEVVTPAPSPTLGMKAPEDATVLLDGRSLDAWKGKNGSEVKWKLATADEDSELPYMEVVRKTGSIQTKQKFGDMHLHLEFATPNEVKGSSQGRGNSGVFLMGMFEIQVLDSYENESYADGQCAAMYGQYPPDKNACLKPGEWQTYDIFFEPARFEADGKLKSPAIVTVYHNGVKVHDKRAFMGPSKHKRPTSYAKPLPLKGPIGLQDHGNPTRFRNIWVSPIEKDSSHELK